MHLGVHLGVVPKPHPNGGSHPDTMHARHCPTGHTLSKAVGGGSTVDDGHADPTLRHDGHANPTLRHGCDGNQLRCMRTRYDGNQLRCDGNQLGCDGNQPFASHGRHECDRCVGRDHALARDEIDESAGRPRTTWTTRPMCKTRYPKAPLPPTAAEEPHFRASAADAAAASAAALPRLPPGAAAGPTSRRLPRFRGSQESQAQAAPAPVPDVSQDPAAAAHERAPAVRADVRTWSSLGRRLLARSLLRQRTLGHRSCRHFAPLRQRTLRHQLCQAGHRRSHPRAPATIPDDRPGAVGQPQKHPRS